MESGRGKNETVERRMFVIWGTLYCRDVSLATGIRNVISDEQRAVYNVTRTTVQVYNVMVVTL